MPYYYCRGYLLAATLTATALLSPATATPPTTDLRAQTEQQRLAVVVPAYKGDLDRAVASLGRWPTDCSSVTQQNVDLVLYYAEGEEDAASVDAAATALAESAGRCFAKTLTVYAHLSEEDDVYPRGPSVMFYKLFLDERIRSNFSEYDALAIIEWDVLVATDRSFEELYHAAFRVNEEFWVKGSNLEGTNFHSSSMMSDMWHVLGHINGNAIYNNNDQAFVEYVDYTRARWEDNYPYDVALWLTISDFPYSWPLYQRFSNKFVTTNLIAYVGKAHVDHGTVTDAIAGQTLFIHGKNVDEGSNLSVEKVNEANGTGKNGGASKVVRKLQNWKENEKWKTFEEPKWETSETRTNENVPKAARKLQADSEDVYDRRRLTATQDGSAPKVARKLQKWRDANKESGKNKWETTETAKNESVPKAARRLQADSEDVYDRRRLTATQDGSAPRVARKLQKWRDANKESGKNKWETTETAKNESVPKAARRLQADSEDVYDRRRLTATQDGSAPKVARKLQKWRDANKESGKNKWETTEITKNESVPKAARKLQADSEDVYDRRRLTATQDGNAPKVVRKLQKWRDANKESGKNKWETTETAKNESVPKAARRLQADSEDVYDRRRLTATQDGSAPKVARKLQKWRDANKESGKNKWETTETAKDESVPKVSRELQADSEDVYTRRRLVETPTFAASADRVEVSRFFEMESVRPFAEDVERNRVCAFVAGTASQVDQIEVTVSSVLEFVPGMRVVVAAEVDAVDAYERAVGGLPGVSVSSTQSVFTASFFADEYCGVANTTLIYYLKTGSVVSRSFTSKDTHSPQGDLLVVFGKGHSGDLADRTANVLGFEAPPFTTGTDLILPVGANADLRAALASEKTVNDAVGAIEDVFDLGDTAAVPQMLAALQYKRAAPGIWFFNPQEWVTNHLFQTASIWEIPLVKPRFTCELDHVSSADESDVADILQRNLDFFAMGGTCERGVIAMQP